VVYGYHYRDKRKFVGVLFAFFVPSQEDGELEQLKASQEAYQLRRSTLSGALDAMQQRASTLTDISETWRIPFLQYHGTLILGGNLIRSVVVMRKHPFLVCMFADLTIP
jgi:hypothetical protein